MGGDKLRLKGVLMVRCWMALDTPCAGLLPINHHLIDNGLTLVWHEWLGWSRLVWRCRLSVPSVL